MEAEIVTEGCHLAPSDDDKPDVENLNAEISTMSDASSLSSSAKQGFYHSRSSSSSSYNSNGSSNSRVGRSLGKEELEHVRSGSSSFSNGNDKTQKGDRGSSQQQQLRRTQWTKEGATKGGGGGGGGRGGGTPDDVPPAGREERGGGTSNDAPPGEGGGKSHDDTLRGGGGGGGRGGEGGAGAAEEGGEDGEEDDDFAWGAPKHIFVLSSAGKPVFSLSGDEQHLATLTGLIQGLLSLCEDCDGDEMESISAGSRKFVFLKRGDLVLVAVSSPSASGAKLVDDGGGGGREGGGEEGEGEETEAPECESFLRLQLEYMYASILFLLTSKVQEILRRSPGYDLRGLLGGADTSLRGAIDLSEPCRGRGRMLAGGVETVWMDPSIRTKVSRDLQTAQAAAAPSALYALWLCGEKLVSLAQPKEPSHRLDSRDLLLLVNFVATQPALRNAESWTPVCFPRFQEKGHLYAYIAFLEEPTAPTLPATTSATTTTNGKPASGRGGGGAEDSAGEEGGGGASTRTKSGRGEDYRLAGESCVILVSVEASSEQFQAFRRARIALETRFRSALGTNWDRYLGMGGETEREGILTKFCTQMQALHFYYCLRGRRGGAPCVTQCLSSPFVGPLADDADAQRVVWGCYTRAALRLRRGSCQEGRVFCGTGRGEWCLDEQRSSDAAGGGGAGGGGGRGGEGVRGEGGGGDQATALFESDPVHSLTYEIGPKVTVMSLFGRRSDGSGGGRWTSSSSSGRGDRDELHACFPSSVPPEVAYKAAVRLVAIVRRDRDWLFLTGTGAPK